MFRLPKGINKLFLDTARLLKRKFYCILLAFLATFSLGAQLDVSRVMTIGRNALYFRDYMVAIGYFNKVLELRPWMAEPYFLRGYAKMMLEDYAGAREDASLALERNAFLGQAYLVRAIANHSLKAYKKASDDYCTALRLSPDDTGIRFNLAGTLYEQEKYAEADSLAQQVPPKTPVYALALLLRGDIALKKGDSIAAMDFARLSLDADSTHAQAYAFMAELFRLQDKYPQAITQLDKAIALAPDNSALYINRGLLHYMVDSYVKAIEDYNQALLLEPSNSAARYNRALLRSSLGDLNNALEDFQILLAQDPSNDLVCFNTGLLQSQLGDYHTATAQFSKILNKYPDFLPAYMARSEARRKLGDLAGSDRDRYTAYNLQKKQRQVKREEKGKKKEKPTRSEEEKTIEAYQSLIANEDRTLSTETTMPESLRGRVQDRTAKATPMGLYYLTFYIPEEYLAHCKFDARLSEYNSRQLESKTLYSTAQSFPLDSLQTTEATQHLSELDAHILSSPYYYLTRGLYKYALVDLEGALADFERALELNPQFSLALFARATVRCRLIELSASVFSDKSEPNSTADVTTFVLGKKLTPNKNNATKPLDTKTSLQYREIIKDLDTLIKRHPDMSIALYNRALVAERLGDKEAAIAYYTQASQLSNAPAEVFFNRGLLYLSLGKKEEAMSDLSRAGEGGLYQAYSILKRIQ